MNENLKVKTIRPIFLISILISILLLSFTRLPATAGSRTVEQPAELAGALLVTPHDVTENSIDYTGCGGQNVPTVNAGYEQELVYLINQERTARGLPPLKRAEALDNSARYHAYDLGQDNYFSHDTMDLVNGELTLVCSAWDRIVPYYTPPEWQWLGETIAGGQPSAQDTLNGLMGSEPHRAILLSSDMWEIGVGYYQTEDGRNYWVQDFGKRSSTYPLVINADAARTLNQQVSLFVYGTWQEVRLRNDDLTWSEWMPFSAELQWVLANTPGDHTVWAELRSGTESVVTSDSINVAATVPLTEIFFLPLTLR
jgi:uncharacterized protein YkwD